MVTEMGATEHQKQKLKKETLKNCQHLIKKSEHCQQFLRLMRLYEKDRLFAINQISKQHFGVAPPQLSTTHNCQQKLISECGECTKTPTQSANCPLQIGSRENYLIKKWINKRNPYSSSKRYEFSFWRGKIKKRKIGETCTKNGIVSRTCILPWSPKM